MPGTSALGPAVAVEGLILGVGVGTSPGSIVQIANVVDFTLPAVTNIIDVTNVSDKWRRHFPTLLDMGKIMFKIWWQMAEATHKNVAGGLRYLQLQQTLCTFQAIYADGPGNTSQSSDSWPGYVVSFSITGKVGSAFEAAIEIANSGAPSLV